MVGNRVIRGNPCTQAQGQHAEGPQLGFEPGMFLS